MATRTLITLLLLVLPASGLELKDLEIGGLRPGTVYRSAEEFLSSSPASVHYNRPFEKTVITFAGRPSGESVALRADHWPANLLLPTPADLNRGSHSWLPEPLWPQGVNLKIMAVSGDSLTSDGQVLSLRGNTCSSLTALLGEDFEGENGFLTWSQQELFLKIIPIPGEPERIAEFNLGYSVGWSP